MLSWAIDALASRYGWTKQYIEEEMYWEEVWSYTTIASNFTAEERNAEFKFQFMLHADSKSASNWKDLPIPFPNVKPKSLKQVLNDSTGVKQLKTLAPHVKVGHLPFKKTSKSFEETKQ